MSTANAARSDLPVSPEAEVPEYLVYERLNGMPVYYRNYKLVLDNKLKPEDIIGYGELRF